MKRQGRERRHLVLIPPPNPICICLYLIPQQRTTRHWAEVPSTTPPPPPPTHPFPSDMSTGFSSSISTWKALFMFL